MYKMRFIIVLAILCIVESIVIGGLLIDRHTKDDFMGNEVNDGNTNAESFPPVSYQELCEYLYRLDINMLQDEQNSNSNFDKGKVIESYIERLKDIKKAITIKWLIPEMTELF